MERQATLPDQIQRVPPASPPAGVLGQALAPHMMIGWPSPVSDAARAPLAPPPSPTPQVTRVTGRGDGLGAIKALVPDLTVDDGNATGRYAELAHTTQQRRGVPIIRLDGSIDHIPKTFRAWAGSPPLRHPRHAPPP